MKLKVIGLLVILMCAISVEAQAPQRVFTVNQCRLDEAQWLSKLTVPNQAGIKSVLAGALLSWVYEMNQCVSLDEANTSKYLDVERMAIAAVADRMNNFIHRHGLTEQFFNEDVVGKR